MNNILGKVDDSVWREEEGMRINIYNFILGFTEPFFSRLYLRQCQ